MNQKYMQIADWTFLLLQRAGKSVSSWLWIAGTHCRKAPVKSSPQSEVPQTARSWWPSPLGCRSWRTEPKSSPDRWPSQGTHTPCYRSMACTSPVRRQNSPTGSKHTHTHTAFSTSCAPYMWPSAINICHASSSNTVKCHWSLTMQRTGVIMDQLHFIHGFGL